MLPVYETTGFINLDVSVNKPFKKNMREHWNKWMEDPSNTYRKNEVAYHCTSVWQWKKSWDGVNTEIIVKSLKKCGISNALDGTEDDALFEDSDDSSRFQL